MEIKIGSSDQFDSLLDALSGEIVDAEVIFKLHMDLSSASTEYKKVFNNSRTFWGLTRKSLLDATLSRLCRIYDQHAESLNLRNLLDTIKTNLSIFDTCNFKERLHANPFVESLAQTARKPDAAVLANDMKSVSETDPLVKKLVVWRNNIIAHRSAINVIKNKKVANEYPLTKSEVTQLLDRATTILNRYSGLFRASIYSTQAVGHDDYLYVLKSINEKLSRQREEFNAHIAKSKEMKTP